MLEKVIESTVVNYAKNKGWLAYKFTSPASRGVPDRLFMGPFGQFFFIEFKRKGYVPTALQEVVFKEIESRNIKVFVVDDIERGKQLIDKYSTIPSTLW